MGLSAQLSALSPAACVAMLLLLAGCKRDAPVQLRKAPGAASGTTRIHQPDKLTSIETGKLDALGRAIRVNCVTCHSTRDAAAFPRTSADLRQFHVGLEVRHGSLLCTSCHVARAGGEPRLHLADGTELATVDSIALCAQCHGPKYQAYLHGAHGGMTGYWDLSQGDRLRNHCVDCHDPHAPAFAGSHPVLPPRDRFLTRTDEH